MSFKRHASTERFNFDLHKTTGFYTSLVLFVVLFSGIYFNLYDQFLWLVERFSPVTRITQLTSNSLMAGAVISVESAIASAQQHFSVGKIQSITVPPDEKGAYRICWQDVKSLSTYVINWRCVGVDQYSEEVTDVIDPQHGTAGDVFLQWQWPLHSGQAFGWAGRILVFMSGLACPVLFVTGIIRWLQKRRAQKLKQRKVCDMTHFAD